MTQPTRILFLDVDGVLNHFGGEPAWRVDVGSIDPPHARAVASLDPACVERLNAILDATGADVVLSSTWRIMYELDDMQRILERRGFRHELLDKTPRMMHVERGHEIQAWLQESGPEEATIVILDDDVDMCHLEDRLVRTNIEEGLTNAQVEQAVRMLLEK